MSEYTVELDGEEYKFSLWKDAEAFIQKTVDSLEELKKDILEYQDMIGEAKRMCYINLNNSNFPHQ